MLYKTWNYSVCYDRRQSSIKLWRVVRSQHLFKQGQSHQLFKSLFTGCLRSSSDICVSTALPHPSEFRSVFIERNNHDQTPFLGVGCRDVFGQGARLKNQNASQTSQRQVIQVLMKFFCELARKLILESFDRKCSGLFSFSTESV